MTRFIHCLICGGQEGPYSIEYNPLIDGWVCRLEACDTENNCATKAQTLVADYRKFDLARREQHRIYESRTSVRSV